jgi:HlyD family secretion protein
MFVECAVDEADVADVQLGQRVRINTEAFPGQFFDGVVDRINPSATTTNNITAVKVRVRVLPGYKIAIKPGMNATCEFITLSKPNVLMVPAQAVKREGGKATVRVKTADPLKPEVREIKLGVEGNEGFEVVEGLKEGEEVVIAELDLAALRETQRRMQEVQEGGGLAGGRPGGGRPGARPSGGGGARPGGAR